MKEKLLELWIYFVMGLAVLGVIIMYGVSQASTFNLYIFGFGALLLVPAIISLIIDRIDFGPKARVKYLHELKSTGMPILVDLANCKILTNRWTITKPEKSSSTIIVNALTDNSYANKPTVDAVLSRVQYSCLVNGRKRKFTSPTLIYNKTSLQLLLGAQKTTNIYIDREEPRYYYFDLEFLNEGKVEA